MRLEELARVGIRISGDENVGKESEWDWDESHLGMEHLSQNKKLSPVVRHGGQETNRLFEGVLEI
jgi:hypothetical protein